MSSSNFSFLLVVGVLFFTLCGCNNNILKNGKLDPERVEYVFNKTQKIRDLPLKKDIPIKLVNKEALKDYFEKEFRKEFPAEKVNNLEKTYKKIGFLEPKDNLLELLSSFKADSVVGIYDDETKEIFLLQEPKHNGFAIDLIQSVSNRDSIAEMVLSHELTHGLQDQHFDLHRITTLCKTNEDFDLATSALIEGDADYTSQGLLNPLIIPDRRKLGYLEVPEQFLEDETIAKAPKILVLPFIFQYLYGAGFVIQIMKAVPSPDVQTAYKRVDMAFKDLPKSTEQIIYPKKYLFQRDDPTPVSLEAMKKLFSKEFKVLHEDTMGQLISGIWIAERLSLSEGYQVSDGWDGDRYMVIEDPKTKRLVFAQTSVWDAEIDAIQYFNACLKMSQTYRSDFVLTEQKGDLLAEWKFKEQRIYLKRIKNKVVFLDGVTETELAKLKVPVTNQLLTLREK